MTLRQWTFNFPSSGTTLTTANVRSEDEAAPQQVTAGGAGQSWQSSNVRVHHGSTSARHEVVGVTGAMRLPFTAGNTKAACSVYYYGSLSGQSMFALRHASGVIAQFGMTEDGQARILVPTGTTMYGDSGVTGDQWLRFEMLMDTAAATASMNVYAADGTTPLSTVTHNALIATGAITHLDIGLTAGSHTGLMYFDSIQMDDGATSMIGPYVPSIKLSTPNLTLVGTTQASTPVATDGSATVSWPPVSNATRYIAEIAPGLGATSGFTVRSQTATSPYTFTGLGAGPYTLAITAHPDAL